MENQDLTESRNYLRFLQEEAAKDSGGFNRAVSGDITEMSIQCLRKQTAYISSNDPELVRRGCYKYSRIQEDQRILHAEELIRRVRPGPFEDANYFALLAYQAASIEMTIPWVNKNIFRSYLLGTLHAPFVNAFARIQKSSGATTVIVHSGMIDFIYQAAKAVVEALNPQLVNDGKAAARAQTDLNVIKQGLIKNSAPSDRLYKTLESYFFIGYPRAFAEEKVRDEHGIILGVIVPLSERWIIAHEYGHELTKNFDFSKAPNNPSWAKEFSADTNATIATVLSAAQLDVLPPEFPLSAGSFVLACIEILERALSLLTTGQDSVRHESQSHPPNEVRASQIVTQFYHFFDFKYRDTGGFDLDFGFRSEVPENEELGKELKDKTHFFSRVLMAIWESVREQLLNQFKLNRQLHRMWQ